MFNTEETWRPIPGFELSHEVSSRGRIRHHAVMKTRDGNGYPRVTLCAHGLRVDASVHGLVALAFLGPRAPGQHVHHKDGDKRNPRLENLEYLSPREHTVKTRAQDRILRGWRHGNAKLTEDDVRAIRAAPCSRRTTGGAPLEGSYAALAAQYGVSIHTIRSVRERSGWKHLP